MNKTLTIMLLSSLLLAGVLLTGCKTEMSSTEKVTDLKLPDDFVEMVGSPSASHGCIYVTYINKGGELMTQEYFNRSGTPERIHWVKPEKLGK